jgi:hypothetical protein
MRHIIGGLFLLFGLSLVAWAIYEISSPWLTLGVGVTLAIVGLGVAGPPRGDQGGS